MTNWKRALLSALLLGSTAVPARATLITVSGPLSDLGAAAAIIGAPADANDDAAYNEAMQGFNERQNVLLLAALSVDGGTIAAGTRVNSHMIFLNTGPGNSTQANGHHNVLWTFDGAVLGVMSNSNGSLEVASSAILGAIGTAYPAVPFTARGLENSAGPGGPFPNDGYTVLGNQILVGMSVTEPGDWIRVVTRAPEPSVVLLLAAGLIGLAPRRKS